MSKLHSIWLFICRYKYAVVILCIISIVGFFDDNSFWSRYQRIQELDFLRSEIQNYKRQYAEADRELKELETNPKALEKLAREKYYMRRANEDVFVLQTSLDEQELTDTIVDTTQTGLVK